MRAKKSLGQNFLMHQQTAARIADAAGITKDDLVLEIGAGTGMLTRELLARAKKVIAIEADRELVPVLRETFASEIEKGSLELIEGDVRTFDAVTLEESYKLVANIPYYITGEIIRAFLTAEHKPSSMTLLVQKEVAERIARSKKESLLSLSVKAYGTPRIEFKVPRGAFVPAPSVDSAVLSIVDIHSAFDTKEHENKFWEVLHASFAHKRKRLAKNLEVLSSKEAIMNAFGTVELSDSVRSEDVPLSKWRALTLALFPN